MVASLVLVVWGEGYELGTFHQDKKENAAEQMLGWGLSVIQEGEKEPEWYQEMGLSHALKSQEAGWGPMACVVHSAGRSQGLRLLD